MRHPDQSPDDTSTQSYREEQGEEGQTGDEVAPPPPPSLGASIRGAVGAEGAPNDSASPGADADRDAARERDVGRSEEDDPR